MMKLPAVVLICLSLAGSLSGANTPPNLIVILADDMGYSDPGSFGGEISTPALDQMARDGVRLSRFCNGGMCVVSRASLMTGQWWPSALKGFKGTPLLPEKLHAAGYRTALIGKWHLDGHPLDRGFDHFFGFLGGFADHFTGGPGYQLDRADFKDFPGNYYSSDAFTDRAIQFIVAKPSSDAAKPFFLYLSFQAPHNPLQVPREDILKYRGKYLAGWQTLREARFKKQKELGIVSADAELPARPQNLPDWSSLSPEQRDLEDLRMAVYAAMVERMDRGIGRLIASLKQSGQADNTLILFLSDNGADSFSVKDEEMLKQGKLPGDPGSNWQPGTGWAGVSSTPWRLYKISQHAGGITTGGIAWWPGQLGKQGRIEAAPLHMIDVLPTLIEVAGIKTPPSSSQARIAGNSFAPLLRGDDWQRQEPLYFQYLDNRAIRTAEWTLAEVDDAGWELFNVKTDPLEARNLATQQPEVVRGLSDRWLRWWCKESGEKTYKPESSRNSQHYKPQGDRGTGIPYVPSSMPEKLSERYPLPVTR